MLKQGKDLTVDVPFVLLFVHYEGNKKTILIILVICGSQTIMLHCGYSVLN
jgi:hypothetical protein